MPARLKIPPPEVKHHEKNAVIRFSPFISMGNIAVVASILVAGLTAWVQLRDEVGRLVIENESRKMEISKTDEKMEVDRGKLYEKIAENHNEVMQDIKTSRSQEHDDLKELTQALSQRFDRVEDKLEQKQDKRR